MTITLTREEAQQVLDALERLNRSGDTQVFDMYDAPVLIPLLRTRLSAPEPECEWQGLTDDEVIECMKTVPLTSQDRVMGYIRAVEQRLRKKNT